MTGTRGRFWALGWAGLAGLFEIFIPSLSPNQPASISSSPGSDPVWGEGCYKYAGVFGLTTVLPMLWSYIPMVTGPRTGPGLSGCYSVVAACLERS